MKVYKSIWGNLEIYEGVGKVVSPSMPQYKGIWGHLCDVRNYTVVSATVDVQRRQMVGSEENDHGTFVF